jgi:dTMP kinase
MILVLIGIDGAGKTTAARALAQRVPPGTRALVLGNYSGRKTVTGWARRLGLRVPVGMLDAVETLVRLGNVLINSARAARFDGVVIMDRHLHCQLALRAARGMGRGAVVPAALRMLPSPDAVLLLDLPAAEAHRRITARGTDSETLEELQAYRRAYLDLAREASLHVVDAGRAPAAVVDRLEEILAGLLQGRTPSGGAEPMDGRGAIPGRLVR